MIGSLLLDFDALDGRGGDNIFVTVNGQSRDYHFSAIQNLYSTNLSVGDVVTITLTSTSSTLVEQIGVYRLDYTRDDVDGDMGIKNTFITASSGTTTGFTTSVTFTATTRSDAYDFYYKIGFSYFAFQSYRGTLCGGSSTYDFNYPINLSIGQVVSEGPTCYTITAILGYNPALGTVSGLHSSCEECESSF